MLDTAMGAAALSVLAPGQLCATIEIHLRFLRAVTEGALTADVDVIHAGARVVQLRGSVRDTEDREVAVTTGSFAVFAGP